MDDMPEPKRYDAFVCTWHYFKGSGARDRERYVRQAAKTISLYLIRQFYLSPYKKKRIFIRSLRRDLPGRNGLWARFLAM